jgi:hypothetical protein
VIEFMEPTAPFSASDQSDGVAVGERSANVRNGESRTATTGAGRRAAGDGAGVARHSGVASEKVATRLSAAASKKAKPARTQVPTVTVVEEGVLMPKE